MKNKIKIYYVTKNERKIDRAREICKNTNILLEQIKKETPEIQGLDSKEISTYSAKFLGKRLKKPILKLDVSFHINALNGFPGPFIKYINNWLKPEQILKMLEHVKDRDCYWKDSLAFYNKGKIRVFESIEPGTISKNAKGKNGWGMDKIFIPKGQIKTKAELSDKERLEICNNEHWKKFIKFIQNGKN